MKTKNKRKENQTENAPLKEGYQQVVVWSGTLVGKEKVSEFEKWFKEEFNIEVQYLEEILTNTDRDKSENIIPYTGKRNDLLFALPLEIPAGFAIKRLEYGMRWIEDVLSPDNHSSHLYPERVNAYKCW